MKDELTKWFDSHHITGYTFRTDTVFIKGFGKAYLFDVDAAGGVFRKNKKSGKTELNLPEQPDWLINDEIFYVFFRLGDRFYMQDLRKEKLDFQIIRWIGLSPETEIKCDFYPLGIHTGYELLNGSGLLSQWADKAKWYGYKGIGICDRNTFAGSFDLQNEATARKLSYVFGYSLTIEYGEYKIDAKVYASTQKGFRNLLRIQKAINVDREDGLINYIELLKYACGNCLVFSKFSGQWLVDNKDNLSDFIEAFDGFVYYQVDMTEYRAERLDSQVLLSMKAYFDTYYRGVGSYLNDIRPVLIEDAFYVDEDDYKNKIILNKVDMGAAHNQSYRQFMKTLDELYDEFDALFSDKYGDDLFYEMCDNTVEIAEMSECGYDLTQNYAPKYEMTEGEAKKYGNVQNMFDSLIEDGFERLVPKDREKEYRERLEYEKYVIKSTDNVDYYLITLDEIKYAKDNGILVGIGRGSAGGCLISWLLGITLIDPIRWGLIFERFLLPERGGLEARDATKICDDVESNEYYEIALENGKKYKFDRDSEFMVVRDGKEIVCYADELEDGDDIIFDRYDELWTLNDKSYGR